MTHARPSHRPALPRPARLALSLPDAGSSGVIDVHDLRAEPLPLSLSSSLARPGPHPSPPPRPWWARAALGSALAACLGLLGIALAHAPGATVATEAGSRVEGQLSMHEASASPLAQATARRPDPADPILRARAEDAPTTDTDADADATPDEALEAAAAVASEPEPEPEVAVADASEPQRAAQVTSRRRSSSRAVASSPTPRRPAAPTPKATKGSIPVECVLDPKRCDASGATAKAPSSGADARPAPLPAKLSLHQLKQALASTKADARRCGPEHGVDPGTTVRVKLSIEGVSGSVLSATPQGEHAQGSLGQCVARAVGQTRFPRFTAPRMGTLASIRL